MEKRPLKKEGISLPGRTRQLKDAKDRDPALWIDWIEYEGPIVKVDAASGTQPIFLSKTQDVPERDQAREVLEEIIALTPPEIQGQIYRTVEEVT